MKHIGQTKVIERFTGPSEALEPPGKIVPFPGTKRPDNIKYIRKEHPDWKERLITPRQFWYIRLLAQQSCVSITRLNKACFKRFGADLNTMKRTDASDVIQDLKRSLKGQYKPFH